MMTTSLFSNSFESRLARMTLLFLSALLGAGRAEAETIQIDLTKIEDGNRIIWQKNVGDFEKVFDLSILDLGLLGGVGLGLTNDESAKDNVESPIFLNDELALVVSGNFTMPVSLFHTLEWTEPNPLKGDTMVGTEKYLGALNRKPVFDSFSSLLGVALLNKVTLTGTETKISLVCRKATCDKKALFKIGYAESGPLSLNYAQTGINIEIGWASLAYRIMESTRWEFTAPCTFSVSPSNVTFPTVREKATTINEKLAEAKTGYEITCAAGIPGQAYLSLRPADGVIEGSDNRLAAFKGNDSVALAHTVDVAAPSNCSEAFDWTEKHNARGFNADGVSSGAIHWLLCSRKEALEAGSYSTTVEVEAWVD